jgi:cytochrome P450
MIEAGSETTAQILNNTIVGLLSNPEAIKLCQEELDRVIGSGRTPSVDDVKDLPYVRSLVKVRCLECDGRVESGNPFNPIRAMG